MPGNRSSKRLGNPPQYCHGVHVKLAAPRERTTHVAAQPTGFSPPVPHYVASTAASQLSHNPYQHYEPHPHPEYFGAKITGPAPGLRGVIDYVTHSSGNGSRYVERHQSPAPRGGRALSHEMLHTSNRGAPRPQFCSAVISPGLVGELSVLLGVSSPSNAESNTGRHLVSPVQLLPVTNADNSADGSKPDQKKVSRQAICALQALANELLGGPAMHGRPSRLQEAKQLLQRVQTLNRNILEGQSTFRQHRRLARKCEELARVAVQLMSDY